MKYRRAHPVTIIANLRKVLFLALVPLLHGGLLGLLAVILMLGFAVWLWLRVGFGFGAEYLALRTGLFNRRTLLVPLNHVTLISFLTHFSLAPFKAVRFTAGNLGGKRLSVILSRKHADELKKYVPNEEGSSERPYRPARGKIAARVLLTSNSFGGILYLATFVSQSGKLLGREFSGAVHAALEQAASLLHIGLALSLPPAAEGVAVLLLAGWLISFGRMFLRYNDFELTRGGDSLTISGGFLSRYEHHLKLRDVFFADIRQSLLTRLFRLNSLYINDICILFGENALSPAPRQMGPTLGSLLRFIGLPLTALAAMWPAFKLIARVYPGFEATLGFTAVMAAALGCWFLAVKLADYHSSGVSSDSENYTLRYSKRLSFHTVIIPKSQVAAFEIRRSPLMRLGPYCDLVVYTKNKSRFTCTGLIKTEVISFLQEVL